MAEREINRDKASMNSHQFATMTRQEDDTIDLIALFYKLLDGWKWIVLAAVIGGLSFGAYTIYCIKPTYRATSTIYMLSNSDTVINMADLQIGSALTKDYVKVFDMWEVHEQVISKLNLPYSYNQMRRMLSV